MSSHKEHHYVPQFYLRRFSTDEDRKLIGLYHYRNRFLFYKAPIRKQAKEKNYYGKTNAVEKILSDIEYDASIIIQEIIQNRKLPAIKSAAYSKLMYFIMFQERRTKYAETMTNQQIDLLMETSYAKFGQKPPAIPRVSINELLVSVVESFKMCNYLKCQIVVNKSKVPFITSDNPVVMNNELMETLGLRTASGWASKGIQVFYPISSEIMLAWSDPFVYRCGGKSEREVITTYNEVDIHQLNALQFLNCQEQIFFSSEFKRNEVANLVKKWNTTKYNSKPRTFEFGSYSFVYGVEYNIKLKLSFNKINQEGKRFRPMGRLVYFRHPDLEKERAKRE